MVEEQRLSHLNRMKILTQWRKWLRLSKTETLKKQIQSSEDELLDLQELTDIRRSVSRAEPNLENELEDLRNELKDEIEMLNDNVKKIKDDKYSEQLFCYIFRKLNFTFGR